MLKQIIDYFTTLGIPSSASVSIILTTLTFCLGYAINWTVSAISAWKKRKNYRKNLKLILKNFFLACKRQYEQINQRPLEKGFLNGNNYIIPRVSNPSLRYLSNLDINIFIENFSSVINKFRPKEITALLELIEKVNLNKELLDKQVDFTYSNYIAHLNIYNDNIDSIRRLHDDLVLMYNNHQLEPAAMDYTIRITSIFQNWQTEGASSFIVDTLTKLVNPIYELSTQLPINKFSKDFIDYSIKCRAAAENIQNIEQLLRDALKATIFVNKESYRKGQIILSKW